MTPSVNSSRDAVRRSRMISAMIETAISSGVSAPIATPSGAWTSFGAPAERLLRPDSFESRLDPATRTNHANESARLQQRRAHRFFVKGMAASDRHEIAMTVETEDSIAALKRLHDDFVGIGNALAIRERCAIVDHGDMEPEHRADRALSGSAICPAPTIIRRCAPDNRIDEQARRAVGFEMRDRVSGPIPVDLDQSRNRVGGRALRFGRARAPRRLNGASATGIVSGIDNARDPDPASPREPGSTTVSSAAGALGSPRPPVAAQLLDRAPATTGRRRHP